MGKFRKKPVVIDAVRWEGATIGMTNGRAPSPPTCSNAASPELEYELPEWLPSALDVTDIKYPGSPEPGHVWRDGDSLFIGTLEGVHEARPGDWVIRGIKGELYPCKPDIFAATYETADHLPTPKGGYRAVQQVLIATEANPWADVEAGGVPSSDEVRVLSGRGQGKD
jgi:hypothetical protein